MRCDIALDPKATHYCKYCGLTMKAREQLECSARDGDLCEAKRREPRATVARPSARRKN